MTSVYLQGTLIGLAIAAPVGPIGLLCIRRTLRDGRLIGIATGMGAATADGLYGLITAMGLSVSGLLVSHGDWMRLGGGLLILYLGVSTFLRGFQPQGHNAASAPPAHAPLKAYGTTFLLTVSNPATIIAFIGMISGLSKGAESGPGAAYWLVLGVFCGSALWWFILVGITSLLRGLVSDRFMQAVDFGSGALLTFWGVMLIWQAGQTLF
ncbi:LysE family transporter [uncultured Cohaesibacter sp.]|uniref:LysE/ArgO family amino acid transporter n=1 Tax=uncultured Cohaesibacter sp. TaxID=1002546 RepID=UPI0029C98926|nr:LysE family transporter [uncultured Cohaesibacter sp.]